MKKMIACLFERMALFRSPREEIMKKMIICLMIFCFGQICKADPLLEEKFTSLDTLRTQWSLSENAKFMTCENGVFSIIDEVPPKYRCISLLKKDFPLESYVLKINITVQNDNEEWCGVYIGGVNFLIRRGGFNYTYKVEGDNKSINHVIPMKIERGKLYSFKIVRKAIDGNAIFKWYVEDKEIASFSESRKIMSNGAIRIGTFGMGASFSGFELNEYKEDGEKMKEAKNMTSQSESRDVTLANTINKDIAQENLTDIRENDFKGVLAKKNKIGLTKFPIGAYMDSFRLSNPYATLAFSSDAEIKDWNDIGFTLVMSPAFNSSVPEQRELMSVILKNAAKYGMKVLLADRHFYNRNRDNISLDDFRNELKEAGVYFGKYDSFAGFMVADEPTEKDLKKALDLVKVHREAIPGKIPFINFGFEPSSVGKKSWDDFFSSVIADGELEILSYDFYGQMLEREKLSSYYFMLLENLRTASLKNGTPFWFVGLVTPHLYFIEPNFNDLRWQFNTAICYGASGYFWWFYYDERHGICANYQNSPIDWNGDKTASWYNLKRIQQKFHHQYGDLFNHLVSVRLTNYPEKIGVSEKWTPNEIMHGIEVDVRGEKNSLKHNILVGEFMDSKENRYIMLVNNSRVDNVSLRLKFPDNAVLYHYANGLERQGWASEYGIGKHWLAPGQEVVYKVVLTK